MCRAPWCSSPRDAESGPPAAALVAAHCLELDPDDPLAATRRLRTTTFFGAFELDPTGLQRGHRLAVIRWRGGRRELLLADAA
jgi:hypothetical protein